MGLIMKLWRKLTGENPAEQAQLREDSEEARQVAREARQDALDAMSQLGARKPGPLKQWNN